MCGNCKYINKDSFYNDIVYEGAKSERVEVVGYCEKYDQEVWVNTDECTNYEESEEAECDNNHDCEHCDWTECPLEVERESEEEE